MKIYKCIDFGWSRTSLPNPCTLFSVLDWDLLATFFAPIPIKYPTSSPKALPRPPTIAIPNPFYQIYEGPAIA